MPLCVLQVKSATAFGLVHIDHITVKTVEFCSDTLNLIYAILKYTHLTSSVPCTDTGTIVRAQ